MHIFDHRYCDTPRRLGWAERRRGKHLLLLASDRRWVSRYAPARSDRHSVFQDRRPGKSVSPHRSYIGVNNECIVHVRDSAAMKLAIVGGRCRGKLGING